MPFYDYRCPDCGSVVELFRKIIERSVPTFCPCQATKVVDVRPMERLISTSGSFSFKGGGWAADGYGSKK